MLRGGCDGGSTDLANGIVLYRDFVKWARLGARRLSRRLLDSIPNCPNSFSREGSYGTGLERAGKQTDGDVSQGRNLRRLKATPGGSMELKYRVEYSDYSNSLWELCGHRKNLTHADAKREAHHSAVFLECFARYVREDDGK